MKKFIVEVYTKEEEKKLKEMFEKYPHRIYEPEILIYETKDSIINALEEKGVIKEGMSEETIEDWVERFVDFWYDLVEKSDVTYEDYEEFAEEYADELDEDEDDDEEEGEPFYEYPQSKEKLKAMVEDKMLFIKETTDNVLKMTIGEMMKERDKINNDTCGMFGRGLGIRDERYIQWLLSDPEFLNSRIKEVKGYLTEKGAKKLDFDFIDDTMIIEFYKKKQKEELKLITTPVLNNWEGEELIHEVGGITIDEALKITSYTLMDYLVEKYVKGEDEE